MRLGRRGVRESRLNATVGRYFCGAITALSLVSACGSEPAASVDFDATATDGGSDARSVDVRERDVPEPRDVASDPFVDALADVIEDSHEETFDAVDTAPDIEDVGPDAPDRVAQCFPVYDGRDWADPPDGFGRRVYVGDRGESRVAIQQAFNLDLRIYEQGALRPQLTRTIEGFQEFLIGVSESGRWLFLDPAGGELHWNTLNAGGFVATDSFEVPENAIEGDHAYGDTALRDVEGTVWLSSAPGDGEEVLRWQPLEGTYAGIRFAGPTEFGNGLLAAWTDSGRIDLYQLAPDSMIPTLLWTVESEMRFIDDVAATQREQVVAAVGSGGLQIFSPDGSLLLGFRSTESDYADVARWESPTGKLGFATAADDHTTLWSVDGESVQREWSWVGGGQLFNFGEQSNSGSYVGGQFYSTSHLLAAPGGFHFEPVWQPTGSLFEANLDADGKTDLVVSVTSLSDVFAWSDISPSTRPQLLDNEYNGMRARYDSCTPLLDGWGINEEFVCTGNFMVTLRSEGGRLIWNRRGTAFFEQIINTHSRISRIASLGNRTVVILVDLLGFDGLEGFPEPPPSAEVVTYALHLDELAPPMQISNANSTWGLADLGPELGYIRFGEDGAWWVPEVNLVAGEFFGPVRVTDTSLADAVPVVVPGEDPRLLAVHADGTI